MGQSGLGGSLFFPNHRLSESGRMELRGYRDGARRNGRPLVPESMGNWAAETLVEIPPHPVPYSVLCGGLLRA